MILKQTLQAHKSLSHPGRLAFSPAGLITKLLNAVKINVPVGYQDETGFHTGVKSDDKSAKWPSIW